MGGAVNSFLGGIGQIGGDVMSGDFGGALGHIGSDLAGAPGWIGSQLGGLGNMFGGGATGQPTPGTPNATIPSLSQSVPNVAGGGSGSGASAGSIASDMNFGGSSSSLEQALGNPMQGAMGTLAGLNTPEVTFGGGVPQVAGAAPAATGNTWSRSIIPALGLAKGVYEMNQPLPNQRALEAMAQQNSTLGHTLSQNALQEMQGQLPGGAEAGIQQALQAAQAQIRSTYASMGLTGSTMESQDLANASTQAEAQRFSIGQQMAQTGLAASSNADSLSAGIYQELMQGFLARNQDFNGALAEFAGNSVQPTPIIPGG